MSTGKNFLAALLLSILAAASAAAVENAAARVIVVANADDPESLRVATHYAEKRGVPRENIIALHASLAETITWAEFISSVWQPLQDALVRGGWIDAIPMELRDGVGRRKPAISGHRISYLVTCRGIPLRIAHDPALYHPHPPITDNPFFRTNEAAVDSELSLLAVTDSPINAFLANPLFNNDHPTPWQLAQVVKVSRLDGPTADDACALVDHAIEAEQTGLLGRAYVDIGGIRPEGDRWLEDVATELAGLGFDLDVDRASTTFPATARFDAPVLYFGWYAAGLNGPFKLPGFMFPPGAIAVHIHSASAVTLRSSQKGWTGPLVARGVTATVGNVFEPYLQLLHRPDLLLRALARGDSFGDAACYALPALSWQSIAIGDPLYRPFAGSFEGQWKNRARLPAEWKPYAILREFHRLDSMHQSADALGLLAREQKAHASLALGLRLAETRVSAGDLRGATDALAFAASLTAFRADEWALARRAAGLLLRANSPDLSAQVYLHLFGDPLLPPELRTAWTNEAQEAVRASGDTEKTVALSRLIEPPPIEAKKERGR